MAERSGMKLLSVNGVWLVLADLTGAFERATGHAVAVALGEAGDLRARIQAGEAFDAAILPRPAAGAGRALIASGWGEGRKAG